MGHLLSEIPLTPPRTASVRFTFATFAAVLVAAMFGGRAGAGSSDWTADLAPVGACPTSNDALAPLGVRRSAIVCLVNWARRRHGMRVLSPSRPLRRAAVEKGRRVASCGQLTHAPCGTDPRDELRATGFPFYLFGENIWTGPWGYSARGVVAGWLGSPPHRANLLRPGFRFFGAGLVHAPGFLGNPDGAVWVATFASRRR